MTPRSLRSALIVALLALFTMPTAASAAPDLEVGIADENVLQGLTPGGTDATVRQWKASGVDDVRIFAQWNKLVPQASSNSTKQPAGFDGTNPASYDFSVLDRKIDAVVKHGLNVTLVVTGPGPVWSSSEPARKNGTWKPSPAKFGEFSTAVAKHVGARVDRYIVWNEPNQGYWLQPQFACRVIKGRPLPACTPVSPHVYRNLARAGYSAIRSADPAARVAVGATSSRGDEFIRKANSTTPPITFLRAMGCVTSRYKATRSGACRRFKPVTGSALAYHPHSLQYSPGKADPFGNNARMADLPRLTRAVDRIAARGGLKVAGAKRMPLWLDEYGYQTNPPDERDGFQSPALAASYLQWGWSLAARNPRVETLTQYEWFDENTSVEGAQAFNRWQSGLYTFDAKPKALASVFANPIFGWRTSRTAYVWGQVRPGDGTTSVRLQRRSGSSYRAYKTVRTDRNGVFQVRVPRSTTARYRFVYVDPTTQAEVTSAATALRKP